MITVCLTFLNCSERLPHVNTHALLATGQPLTLTVGMLLAPWPTPPARFTRLTRLVESQAAPWSISVPTQTVKTGRPVGDDAANDLFSEFFRPLLRAGGGRASNSKVSLGLGL